MKEYLMKVLILLTFAFGMNEAPAFADIAIAINGRNEAFSCAAANLNSAESCVRRHCEKNSYSKCKILGTSKPNTRGYMAVAQSGAMSAWATGYRNQEAAASDALQRCNQISDVPCKITLKYLDQSAPTSNPNCMINPATGLPMMQPGNCSGFDIQGNPYGANLQL